MRPPLTTLALALLAAGTATGQLTGFTNTCQVDTVKVEGRWLTAQCHNILGTETRCSKLDLNSCLKNNSGRLEDDVFGTGYVSSVVVVMLTRWAVELNHLQPALYRSEPVHQLLEQEACGGVHHWEWERVYAGELSV